MALLTMSISQLIHGGGGGMTEKEMRVELGQRIRAVRKKHKLSQDALSKRVRMTRTQVVHYERGKFLLSIWRLAQIAEALGTQPWRIMHSDWRALHGLSGDSYEQSNNSTH